MAVVFPGGMAAPSAAVDLAPGAGVAIPAPTVTWAAHLKREGVVDTTLAPGPFDDRDPDVTASTQDPLFLARAWSALLRGTLPEADREDDTPRTRARMTVGPRDRRLDATPILPRFRALVLARDGTSPAPVQINGERLRVTETVLVRIWIP